MWEGGRKGYECVRVVELGHDRGLRKVDARLKETRIAQATGEPHLAALHGASMRYIATGTYILSLHYANNVDEHCTTMNLCRL